MALQIWLPLQDNLNNQGLNPMTFSLTGGGGIATSESGKLGGCYERTTSTVARIRSDSTINLNNDFSMACWLYVNKTTSIAEGVITNHSHVHNSGSGITLKHIDANTCYISCNTGYETGRTYATYFGTTNLKGAWHHVGLTYKKSAKTLQLWVDGKVEYTVTNYLNYSRADVIDVFGWSTTHDSSEYTPLVKVNDVRIYDHCLSNREMEELAKGLFLHYQLKNINSITNSCIVN